MKLDGRLGMIAENIPKCRILADVGTDHAFIPIHAVKASICEKALATDVRPGPLMNAEKNIVKHGLDRFIETRLGDGLEPIHESECDVVVIAGMGGPMIRRILEVSEEKAKKFSLLLLQPNNASEAVRRWLYDNGFSIIEEKLAEDDRKLYCLIKTRWTGVYEKGDDFDCYIGKRLMESNDPLLKPYLEKKLGELNTIINGRSKSDPGKPRRTGYDSYMDTRTCMEIRDRLTALLYSR
ncbi:MAG TPA: class I SAM-dependent methyltransferase [Clostridiales bacterium]|nr:class I SAM-dependent methyltransferase [Clostridiales bacterium]HPV02271.1 class I SAM-dependent methyltransferase [Clostridiales bacterium]